MRHTSGTQGRCVDVVLGIDQPVGSDFGSAYDHQEPIHREPDESVKKRSPPWLYHLRFSTGLASGRRCGRVRAPDIVQFPPIARSRFSRFRGLGIPMVSM